MGTWDVGPFDNDDAADWCGDLDEAPAEERPGMIRAALVAAADADADGYLDVGDAVWAIAAAAIVASQLPGGEPIDSAYAPDFLVDGGTVALPDDAAVLAVRALDRIVADESEWRDLWEESDSFDEALAVIQDLRALLAR